MTSIKGELEAGEASGTATAIATHQRGSALVYWLIMLSMMTAGAVSGFAVGWLLNTLTKQNFVQPVLVGIVGLYFGWFSYIRTGRRRINKAFRRNMLDRGLSTSFSKEFTVTDDKFILETGPVRRIAEWSSVTEIFRVKNYWIFLVNMEPWYLPSRFFAVKSEERGFISSVLSRMNEDSRNRSQSARDFLSSQD